MLSNFVFTVIVNTTAVLALGWTGCAGKKPVETATWRSERTISPSEAAASATTITSTETVVANTRKADDAGPPPVVSPDGKLAFQLKEMTERTGTEFGIAAPMLLLTITNRGRDAVELPQPGTDLIISLRLTLKPEGGGKTEHRYATLLRAFTVQLSPFPPGEPIRQGLSPLSLKRDDVPLPAGKYRVAACVPPTAEAPYPSRFTDAYGGLCSNEITIEVKRRR